MDIFDECHAINDLLNANNEVAARNRLIALLAAVSVQNAEYPDVLNHLIRDAGLYPYMQLKTTDWQQRFVAEAFKVDVGRKWATLHREQSMVLAQLLKGSDIAVSAPTSFGKSFIIDAFIASKKPANVVIIVPTIALMDETRRRIFQKFSDRYNIITASDMPVTDRNIFIFPQERVFGYLNKIDSIDLLVVDEFYKASRIHDKERAPSLIKAIIKLSKKASQRYFLAPNIKRLDDNVFTRDMEFIELLDYNTVYLEKHDLYKEIGKDEQLKGEHLIKLIRPRTAKSLIYAGSYPQIDKVANLVLAEMDIVEQRPMLQHFARWLSENYDPNWQLTHLVRRGVGIHNGRMHRSLSQIQVRIFEAKNGFDSIISTSSIIEGVNTSAENVIIWRNKVGNNNLKNFMYKNIIGRGGRMFKHFVGKIYLLEPPPKDEDAQLEIEFPDQILGDIDEEQYKDILTGDQVERIMDYKRSMSAIIGEDELARLRENNILQSSDATFILRLAQDMQERPDDWRGFGYLNSHNPAHWDRMLYQIINLSPSGWDVQFRRLVSFIKVLSRNWRDDLPDLLRDLDEDGIGVELFFHLERNVTFKMSALLSDANELHKIIIDPKVDVSPFISRLSHAFLPRPVHQLEEYGLPRMISRKLHRSGLINFELDDMDLQTAIRKLQDHGYADVAMIEGLTRFDRFILKYFFEGITQEPETA